MSPLLIIVRQEFSKTRLFCTSTCAVTWTTTGNKELTDSNRKMAREPTHTYRKEQQCETSAQLEILTPTQF